MSVKVKELNIGGILSLYLQVFLLFNRQSSIFNFICSKPNGYGFFYSFANEA